MPATRDPWVAIDATIRKNAKVAGLSSDAARWGWIAVLGEAKLQRPQGRFKSQAHFTEAAGRFGRFRLEYLSSGLLEQSDQLCNRCHKAWGTLPGNGYVVHDWQLHQRDPGAADRAEEWRSERSLNADRTVPERSTNDQRTALTHASPARVATATATATKTTTEKGPSSQAPKPVPARRPSSPRTDEPRLTAEQLDAWSDFQAPCWGPFTEAWMGRGLLWPPGGSAEDDDSSQRGLLYQIADARPNDLGRWVKEAPERSPRGIITFVLSQWHGIREVAGVDAPKDVVINRSAAKRIMTHVSEILRDGVPS